MGSRGVDREERGDLYVQEPLEVGRLLGEATGYGPSRGRVDLGAD